VLRTPPPPPPRPQALARAPDTGDGDARARFKYAALFADDRDFSQNQFAEEFRAQESCAPPNLGAPPRGGGGALPPGRFCAGASRLAAPPSSARSV